MVVKRFAFFSEAVGHAALTGVAVFRLPLGVLHRHRAHVAFRLDVDAVTDGARQLGVGEEAGEEPGLFLAGLSRVDAPLISGDG